jgi:Tol biopolymer transport system component
LERKDNTYILYATSYGQSLQESARLDLDLGNEVYVGIFITSHEEQISEQAIFSNVRISVPAKDDFVPYRDYIGSHIETMDVSTGQREIIYTSPISLQAPNWMIDGRSLIYNSNGLIYKLDLKKLIPEILNTDTVKRNNNDHVLSFDGKMLGLSSGDGKYNSIVYTVASKGGVPNRVTPVGPSYLHGWSPDKKFLVYTAERGDGNYDIYKIPSSGG